MPVVHKRVREDHSTTEHVTKKPTPTSSPSPSTNLSKDKDKAKKRSLELTTPGDYDYKNDTDIPSLAIDLRPHIQVRPYQAEAKEKVIVNGLGKSGIIVLPCGAGKTLTSIQIACEIKKSVLVVCSTNFSAEQFLDEFRTFSTINPASMGMLAGSKKWPFNGRTGIIFTTYTMLIENKHRARESVKMIDLIRNTEWGLVILDEVHCVPAENYSKAIGRLKSRMRLGLTATMLREDDRIDELEQVVGKTLYTANWKELADAGYIAKVVCTQIEMPLSPSFEETYAKYADDKGFAAYHKRGLLAVANPNKMQICQRLIQYHEARGDKILVYCDNIDAMKRYAAMLDRHFIYGGTSEEEKQTLLKKFQIEVPRETEGMNWREVSRIRVLRKNTINTLLVSRIGDTSLNLPAATVLIQIASHFGSRRQETQRMGRILRAKNRSEKGFYSRFYTLVTLNTDEIQFTDKRKKFIEDTCGNGYQIWRVGDRVRETGGWSVTATNELPPLEDDEVQLQPLTCSIMGAPEPYLKQEEEQRVFLQELLSIKDIQVERDEVYA